MAELPAGSEGTSEDSRPLDRVSLENFGDCHGVGGGVQELRIDYGPGFRVYLDKTGKGSCCSFVGVIRAPRPGIFKRLSATGTITGGVHEKEQNLSAGSD